MDPGVWDAQFLGMIPFRKTHAIPSAFNTPPKQLDVTISNVRIDPDAQDFGCDVFFLADVSVTLWPSSNDRGRPLLRLELLDVALKPRGRDHTVAIVDDGVPYEVLSLLRPAIKQTMLEFAQQTYSIAFPSLVPDR